MTSHLQSTLKWLGGIGTCFPGMFPFTLHAPKKTRTRAAGRVRAQHTHMHTAMTRKPKTDLDNDSDDGPVLDL